MKTKFRGLTLTALLLSASNMTFADQGATSVVGDLPGYGEEAYFAEEAAYAASNPVQSAHHAHPATAAQPSAPAHQYISSGPLPYAPIAASDLQQVGHHFGGYPHPSACDCGSCDAGCDAAYGRRRSRFGSLLQGCASDTWATAEFLMWFTPNRDMPALVTTSDPGTLPILPAFGAANPDNVAVAFGDPIRGEISGGFRGDVGKYITKNVGIGGRFWILAENNDSYSAQGDGSAMSIGRPFFNTNTAGEDALLVALDGTFTGSVAAESELNLWGAEGYARMRLGCASNCQLDFIGGYSHFQIDDSLRITSTTVTDATARTRTYNDAFDTENRFDGGQVGFEMMKTRGRWMVRSLTKVHMGNMRQNIDIYGNSSDQTPPAAVSNTSGGLLAMGNQGSYQRDVFAFAPEANFKLAFRAERTCC